MLALYAFYIMSSGTSTPFASLFLLQFGTTAPTMGPTAVVAEAVAVRRLSRADLPYALPLPNNASATTHQAVAVA